MQPILIAEVIDGKDERGAKRKVATGKGKIEVDHLFGRQKKLKVMYKQALF